jgi:hypothetical protein
MAPGTNRTKAGMVQSRDQSDGQDAKMGRLTGW